VVERGAGWGRGGGGGGKGGVGVWWAGGGGGGGGQCSQLPGANVLTSCATVFGQTRHRSVAAAAIPTRSCTV